MKSDIEISQETKLKNIFEIAQKLNINEKYIEQYGKHKAKINVKLLDELQNTDGKLILVTAINPTPAGEGKTTVSIGLADALNKLGVNVALALREPSLGPVLGMKGGATGGGYAQIAPMEDINLHFTGDLHAISTANNLLSAMIDNHIWYGNELNINREEVTWNRCVDMNDRQLRLVLSGLGIKSKSMPRMDSYDITAASETMAIFCLASSIYDLKNRLSKAIVAYSEDGSKILAGDLKVEGAMVALLRDAFNPNLVQTLEGTPALVHGGPFANIAHGCNSLVATKMALKLSDYVITEAGFGADLGAEKFFDIKCRVGNLKPSAAVVVATIRALKMHGGVNKENLNEENLLALEKGLKNLIRHVSNLKEVYKLPVVVALNKFEADTQKEIELLKNECKKMDVDVAISEAWEKGGNGGIELAEKVMKVCENENDFQYAYKLDIGIKEKIETIVKKIYHGNGVFITKYAQEQINRLEKMGYGNLPVCIAKTQYSFSDDPQKLGAPEDFKIKVDEVRISAGAGFIVALTEDIMTMPGLPRVPAATKIDVDSNGKITGIF